MDSCVVEVVITVDILAILDIRDDKIGSSAFFKRLINRSKNIHAMFGRGKMLSSAIAIAQEKHIRLKMTQGNCTTRFWSSQYQQFQNIISSFEVYGGFSSIWLLRDEGVSDLG